MENIIMSRVTDPKEINTILNRLDAQARMFVSEEEINFITNTELLKIKLGNEIEEEEKKIKDKNRNKKYMRNDDINREKYLIKIKNKLNSIHV